MGRKAEGLKKQEIAWLQSALLKLELDNRSTFMNFKYLALASGLFFGGLSFSATTMALPTMSITGDISLGFSISPLDGGGGATDLAQAVKIDVNLDKAVVTNTPVGILGGFLAFGSSVTYKDFFLDGTTGFPISPLWFGNGVSFSLESMSGLSQSLGSLSVFGTGVMSAVGYLDTAYAWSFSADSPGEGSFSASAANTPIPVPEPGTLALLGLGLAGLGAARRRQKS
jgi:hypothetical protein